MNARNRILILMGILLIASFCWYLFSTERSTDLQLIGTVDANEVVVSSRIPGRIQQLTVDEAKTGCAKKDASACGQLAVYLTLGLGVPEDRKKAMALAKPGCDAGDALSCYAVGGLLETDGKPADEARALELYEKACTGKASEGCAELAAVYMSGRTSAGADGAKAVDYLKKACTLGDRTSCLQVPMLQTCLDNPTSDDPICKRMQKH